MYVDICGWGDLAGREVSGLPGVDTGGLVGPGVPRGADTQFHQGLHVALDLHHSTTPLPNTATNLP